MGSVGTCIRWGTTVVAAVASSWLVDGLATLVGVAVVASAVLDGVPGGVLVAAALASYVGWGAAMLVDVRANGRLLGSVGVSTSLASKVVHDLVARRDGASERARRVAAAGGYVGLEVVKEVPFLIGAVGIIAVSDSLATPSFFAFLIGANLAAAAYELSVGVGTGALLRRRERRPRSTRRDDRIVEVGAIHFVGAGAASCWTAE
jgi:hypothetical protein